MQLCINQEEAAPSKLANIDSISLSDRPLEYMENPQVDFDKNIYERKNPQGRRHPTFCEIKVPDLERDILMMSDKTLKFSSFEIYYLKIKVIIKNNLDELDNINFNLDHPKGKLKKNFVSKIYNNEKH